MKQKNVIMIVLDSVSYDFTKKTKCKACSMPFLHSLMKKGINAINIYSEAPYTEAALVSLLCGDNTLDKTGHMKRNLNHKSILQIFEENNYNIFSNAYQPAIYPSGQMHEFKNKYYNFPFLFSQVWDYRLKYFSELHEINEKEIELVINIMNDNFKAWTNFFKDIDNKSENMNLIYDTLNLDEFESNQKELKKEYEKFEKDKRNYVLQLLEQKKSHPLAKIKNYQELHRLDKEFKKKIEKKYTPLLKKILLKNFLLNIKNNRMSIIKIKNFIKAGEYKTLTRYFMNYLNALYDRDLINRLKLYDRVKMVPSLYKMLNHFVNWQDKQESDKPFFAYIHAEDNHFPETFFTYDVEDEKLIDLEFGEIKEFLSTITSDYKGSIAYDLSLHYSDNTIKRFFDILKKKDLLKDTIIVITADHGFSYYYNPIRERFVTNYYNETYHIPLAIYKNGFEPKKLDKFYNSKDIVPTILDLAGIENNYNMNSKSMLRFAGRDYALIEFMGGGCPHYYRRDIVLGIRNRKYSLVLSIPLRNFKEHKYLSFYDLEKDPFENNNLAYSKIDKKNIQKELNIIKKRYNEIKENILKGGYYK